MNSDDLMEWLSRLISAVGLYQDYGRAIASLGYVGVLVNGTDIYKQPGDRPEKFLGRGIS